MSDLCEKKGSDLLIYTDSGLLCVQRKECPFDFLKSIEDGRLARETSLMRDHGRFRLLILEGEFRYDKDGHVINGFRSRYTREQIRSLLWSCRYVKNVDYEWTQGPEETWALCARLEDYLNDKTHTSLFLRPKLRGEWGTPTEDELKIWFLQGLPSIGVGLANRILSGFGGKIPMKWTCTPEELAEVRLISLQKAKKLIDFLNS